MKQDKILIIGAGGQIGTVLTAALRDAFGEQHVIASDLRPLENQAGPSEVLNALDAKALAELVKKHSITQIYHLAAILSAKGEADPMKSWEINM
ncbi:MAG: NAD-dependent epimerase/dehydratase family protein [Saprospiraceae bacterium]